MISENWKKYNIPPQIIYKIDDHRFITLESYDNCLGETWYNDTKSGVRTRIGHTWPNGFLGKLIIDDKTGMNVVVPTVTSGSCGDRGCTNYAAYSTDGGRTFKWFRYDVYDHTTNSMNSSKRYVFAVTNDSLFVTYSAGKYGPTVTDRYPLDDDLSNKSMNTIPGGKRLNYDSGIPSGLHTPSGQDHYICDASILPTNGD
ncbi:T6SS immunity protein Tli3 family protein [Caballeronia glebae]|uniref:T6SS immunity protein Tli3 family protein n=1 Tax=Caballeronia glebae TaxID=1777143 RepID=UPI001180989A|nr:hypothetical protein [Caballeronia glebae]